MALPSLKNRKSEKKCDGSCHRVKIVPMGKIAMAKPSTNAVRLRRFRSRLRHNEVVLPPVAVPRGLIEGLLNGRNRTRAMETAATLLVRAYYQKYPK